MARDAISSSSSSSSTDGDASERELRRERRRKKRHRHRSRSEKRRKEEDEEDSDASEEDSRRRRRRRREKEEEERKRRRRRKKEKRDERRRRHRKRNRYGAGSASPSSSSSMDGVGGGDGNNEGSDIYSPGPEDVVGDILRQFPDAACDLKQLLQMIDNGQGVDVKGVNNKILVKLLKKLFSSLKLTRSEDGVYLLPSMGKPTLEIIGETISSHLKARDSVNPVSESIDGQQPSSAEHEYKVKNSEAHGGNEGSNPSKRRLIGPEMPSRELLAAAAELMEAENLLREADLEIDNDLLIGPPPPAMVTEVESANDAERFEEVARIIEADVDKPYDVLGVNWKMSSDNFKKRYWKLSLMVHPDKCSHPQAHQAFVKLNQAFKDLQDPDKRKALDEKIKIKEEEEAMKAELRSLREAAQWRKLQGISMEGDDELLAVPQEAPKRDEWMTTLPPERKPGMTTQSTSFSRTTKAGRGDTSAWTDNPLDKAEKAKQNYLEAYNKTKALGDMDNERKRMTKDAELVDKYNKSKRSVSLLQKHKEESSHPKKKSKQKEKEEWEGSHPWKPWDREKDLTAGRKNVNLDPENMAQGLSTRFSSGAMQRNFL